MSIKGVKRERTLRAGQTLKALERAAMRLVDRNGWLREPTITKKGKRHG